MTQMNADKRRSAFIGVYPRLKPLTHIVDPWFEIVSERYIEGQ